MLSFRGRKDLLRRGIARMAIPRVLQIAAVSGQSPKGGGVRTTSTNVWVRSHLRGWALHLRHSPKSSTSRRGNYIGQRCHLEPLPSSVARKGLHPWPEQGVWSQDSSWRASVKTPASFWSPNGDWILSDRGLKDTKAHSLKRDSVCLMQRARKKRGG